MIGTAAHNVNFNFIFCDQFQFSLPRGWNAIILAPKVGVGPVDVRPLDNVSKRHHGHRRILSLLSFSFRL